jgi:hypothetical protein
VQRKKIAAARLNGAYAATKRLLEIGDGSEYVDVFAHIEHLGIWLKFCPLERIQGVFLPGLQPGILINSNRLLAAQRLTAAHELGHYCLGHGATVDLQSLNEVDLNLHNQTLDSRFLQEVEAQAFANAFLAPIEYVSLLESRIAKDACLHLDPINIYQISLHLGMSYQATVFRIGEIYGYSSQWSCKHLSLEVADLKKKLVHGSKMRDGRFDRWVLAEHLDGMILRLQVGDQLVTSEASLAPTLFVDFNTEVEEILWSAADSEVFGMSSIEGTTWITAVAPGSTTLTLYTHRRKCKTTV